MSVNIVSLLFPQLYREMTSIRRNNYVDNLNEIMLNHTLRLSMEQPQQEKKVDDKKYEKIKNYLVENVVLSGNSEENCSICLSKLSKEINIINCEHSFHHECIMGNIKFSDLCPLCRKPIE